MSFTVRITGDAELQRVLHQIMSIPQERDMYRDLCVWAQSVVQKQFQSNKPGARSGGWPGVPWWAKVISANVGKGRGKIVTMDDARNARRVPLSDQGSLRQSWIAGRTIDVGNGYGIVGTHLPYAEDHQLGRRVTFHFDADKLKKFQHNVSDTRRGGKKGPRAKKNWNPDYFKMLAILRKKDGQQIQLRERQQAPEDIGRTASDRRRIHRIIGLHIRRAMGGNP